MLKNGLYNVVGAIIRSGTTIVTIPLIIRLIGVEEYGLWTLVSSVIGIVLLAEAGLSVSTTVFISKDLANDDIHGISQTLSITLGLMLVLATFAAIGLWLGADFFVSLFPKLEPEKHHVATLALQIGGLAVWGRLLQQIFVGLEQAYQKYGVMNVINTVQICITNIGMLSVAWLGGRTVELMVWTALTNLGGLLAHIIICFALLKNWKLRPAWDKKKVITILRYSSMTWLTSLGSALFSQGDRLIVGAFLGSKILGIYAAITSLTVQINTFSALSIQPLLPNLSALLEQKKLDRRNLKKQIKLATQINGIVALSLGIALLTFAPLILQIMIPEGFTSEHLLAFRITTIIYSLYSINAVGHYILFGINAVNINLAITLISGIFSLLMIAIGSHYFGLLGAVTGNFGYIATHLLNFFGIKKLDLSLRMWFKWLYIVAIWFVSMLIINIFLEYKNSLSSLLYCYLLFVNCYFAYILYKFDQLEENQL